MLQSRRGSSFVADPSKTQAHHESPQCHVGAFVVWNLPIGLQRSRSQLEFEVRNFAETPASARFQFGDAGMTSLFGSDRSICVESGSITEYEGANQDHPLAGGMGVLGVPDM